MTENQNRLPHWNLETLYPSLESEAFQSDFHNWTQSLDDLTAFFDAQGINRPEAELPMDDQAVRTLETLINRLNDIQRRGRKLYSYVLGFTTTDSRNTLAQSWMSKLQITRARLEKLGPRFAAWVGGLDVDAATERSKIAREHAFALEHARIEASHLMSPREEDLAADLNLTGGRAWAQFYNNFSSQIAAEVEVDGEMRRLPMPAIRNLASEDDRELRRRAYEAELAAWEANAMPIASALNSVKGQANTLNERRNWESPLALALFNNRIDEATLTAMMETAKAFFPHFRRYLKAKARRLGVGTCAWYDLFAPVGEFERIWTFDAARAFIVEQFGTFSPSLADLAERAFEERWIDAEPREGKRGGGFCMWTGDDSSRILVNYQHAYGGVSTLAHELGHAYHNYNLRNRTYIQRSTPMTLAETASNFCQIIVRNAALRQAPEQEQLAILEADLQDAAQVVMDITSRYLFEEELFERRHERELSADELCEIMTRAQKATYGDGLDPDLLHPYMWAAKPHYYTSVFYNFPYMFGLLFGLGVYAQYRDDPEGFVKRYEALLSSTGMDDAASLACRFDIDITKPAFWRQSLSLIVEDIDRFERLADANS
ncbi:MAG: M3 family oligoendopeptidase [Anaerolineae bacterium]